MNRRICGQQTQKLCQPCLEYYRQVHFKVHQQDWNHIKTKAITNLIIEEESEE
jgi:hypothetical protein